MAIERIEAWLRLKDAARFQADAKKAAAAVRDIGRKSLQTARDSDVTTRALGGMRSTFGFLATGARYAGFAVGAALSIGTVAGLKFNSTMEQNRVSFTHFLGSTKKANAYLEELYTLAAETPFEFSELSSAAKQMMAFGFQAKEVTSNLRVIGDTASGLGTGTEGINRMVIALGQMKVAGVVQGDELRQFQEAGVNVYKYLEKAGMITKDDIGQIGQMHLDSTKAIDAIMTGMHKDFGGLSKEQAKTWQGQLSTMKDYASQAAGALTEPIFNLLKSGVFPKINDTLQRVSAWAKGGGVTRAISGFKAGLQGGKVEGGQDKVQMVMMKAGALAGKTWAVAKSAFKGFMEMVKPAAPFFTNVIMPLFKGIAKGVLISLVGAFKVVVPILRIFFKILGWIGTVLKPFKGTIEGIGVVIGFVFTGPILKAVGMLGKLGGVFRIVGTAARILSKPFLFLVKVYMRLYSAIGKLAWGLTKGLAGAFRSIGGLIGKVGGRLLNLGKTIVTKIVDGIKAAPGKLIDAISSLIPGPIKSVLGKAGGLLGSIIPGSAQGSVFGQGGLGIVGERGPEVAAFPAGSAVVPLRPAVTSPLPSNVKLAGGGSGSGVTIAKVYLNRRQIAEAVAEEAEDQNARR